MKNKKEIKKVPTIRYSVDELNRKGGVEFLSKIYEVADEVFGKGVGEVKLLYIKDINIESYETESVLSGERKPKFKVLDGEITYSAIGTLGAVLLGTTNVNLVIDESWGDVYYNSKYEPYDNGITTESALQDTIIDYTLLGYRRYFVKGGKVYSKEQNGGNTLRDEYERILDIYTKEGTVYINDSTNQYMVNGERVINLVANTDKVLQKSLKDALIKEQINGIYNEEYLRVLRDEKVQKVLKRYVDSKIALQLKGQGYSKYGHGYLKVVDTNKYVYVTATEIVYGVLDVRLDKYDNEKNNKKVTFIGSNNTKDDFIQEYIKVTKGKLKGEELKSYIEQVTKVYDLRRKV